MNRYLNGTYALATQNAPTIANLARVRPMSAALARSIIGACVGALKDGSDTKRQLTNMANTIAARKLDVLPDAAANALCKAVDCVGDDLSVPPSASDDAAAPEDDTLLVDYGWHQATVTEVVDADGEFDLEGNKDDYEIGKLAWDDKPFVTAWDETPLLADQVVGHGGHHHGGGHGGFGGFRGPIIAPWDLDDYDGGDINIFIETPTADVPAVEQVVGVAVLEWDNHHTYAPGEIVYFNQTHWRALRDVTPPFLPAFMDGDVPGKSDAWRQISPAEVYGGNVVGDYGENESDEFDTEEGEYDMLIGLVDIGQAQIKMNGLKPVTVGIAKSLIRGGQTVMAVATEIATAHELPDIQTLGTTSGHLKWHSDKLATLPDDKAVYDSGDDAKKWAMQAFIEANAVETGAAWVDGAWTRMWNEIGAELAALPKQIVQAIARLPGQAFEAATGIPSWAFYVGAAVLVAGVAFLGYKVITSAGGGAFLGAVVRR